MWLLLCAIGLLAWVPWLVNRWRFRHIPGPFAPPVIGNLPGIAALELHGYLEHCRQRYGPIFKIYIGSSMVVCVAEPAAAKRLQSRLNFRHSGVQLLAGADDWDLLLHGLVGANGAAWRRLRAAWAPAFSPAALQAFAPVMNRGAEALAERLSEAAGSEVELFEALSAMMLGVVCTAAYGADLPSLAAAQPHEAAAPAQPAGLSLDVMRVFAGGGVTNSSHYLPLVLLFPALAPLLQWLAFRWPDAKLARLAQARRRIRQFGLRLVRRWRQQAQQEGAACGAGEACTGAFPRALLAARDGEAGGELLSDEQVVAELNTFVVTSFETTASALAAAIYFLARSPAAEARLLRELDAWRSAAPSKPVEPSDLEQLPFVGAVINEALRLLPPGIVATRSTQAHEALQLTPQVRLPPLTAAFSVIYAFQRDPDVWPAALEFRPERWLAAEGAALQPRVPDAFAPFGTGSRQCVGKRFALQALGICLVRLYERLRFQLADPSRPLVLRQTFALAPAELRVVVVRR